MRWREIIFENLWLKALALVLAAIVWFTVHSHLAGREAWPIRLVPSDVQREFADRPVLVLALPTDHRSFVVEPPTVTVTLSGPGTALQQLSADDVQVFVRPPNIADPSTEMAVSVRAPKWVSTVTTEPATVRVKAQLNSQ